MRRNDKEDFFSVLLLRVLERARKALEVLPLASPEVESGVAKLKALCDNGERKIVVSSLAGVMRALGGKQSVAARVFMSVMDDDEKRELEALSQEATKRAKNGSRLGATTRASTDGFDRVTSFVEELRQIGVPKRLLSDVQVRTARFLASVLREPPLATLEASKTTAKTEERGKGTVKKRMTTTSGALFVEAKKGRQKRSREEPEDEANGKNKDGQESNGEKMSKVAKPVEVDPEIVTLQRRLRDAEEEFETVRGIMTNPDPVVLEGHGQQQCAFPMVDLKAISVESRDCVLNAQLLHFCLCDDVAAPLRSLESIGKLQSWQRVAVRACRIVGIFERLRAQKGEGNEGLRLEQRYAELIATSKLDSAFHFKHAAKYDRLGQFLLRYPDFLYQRQLVTLADWLERIGGKKSAVVDVIPHVLPVSSILCRNAFQLHREGFQVFAGEMKDFVTGELVAYCDGMCEEHGEVIFNNVSLEGGGAKRNDNRRRQLALSKMKTLTERESLQAGDEDLTRFEEALQRKLSRRFENHHADSMVVLLSQENCKAQLPHTDYSDKTLKVALESSGGDDAKMPLACLVALQDGTRFDVWPGAIRFDSSRSFDHLCVILNAGDMLIFRGDLVHAGAATGPACRNVRIHAYLDAEGIDRPKFKGDIEETHFMNKERHIMKRK